MPCDVNKTKLICYVTATIFYIIALSTGIDTGVPNDWNSNIATAKEVTTSLPETQIEAGFTRGQFLGTAEPLIIKAINSSVKEIDVAAYSFTSMEIAIALQRAAMRGVKVYIVEDAHENLSGRSLAHTQDILSLFSIANIELRANDNYSIFHHKFMIIDGKHTELGSFNFSRAAAHNNAENAVVVWDNVQLAKQFRDEFIILFNESREVKNSNK